MSQKIQPPNYQHCPFCGDSLQVKIQEDQERKFCPACAWTYYPKVSTAAGAIIVQDGQVLLVQRAREPYKGTWMLPSGFVDYGEHPADCVVREVREETGLGVTHTEFYGIYQQWDDMREPGHFYLVYRAEVLAGTLTNDPDENLALAWFPLDDLPEIGWESHRQVLGEIATLGK